MPTQPTPGDQPPAQRLVRAKPLPEAASPVKTPPHPVSAAKANSVGVSPSQVVKPVVNDSPFVIDTGATPSSKLPTSQKESVRRKKKTSLNIQVTVTVLVVVLCACIAVWYASGSPKKRNVVAASSGSGKKNGQNATSKSDKELTTDQSVKNSTANVASKNAANLPSLSAKQRVISATNNGGDVAVSGRNANANEPSFPFPQTAPPEEVANLSSSNNAPDRPTPPAPLQTVSVTPFPKPSLETPDGSTSNSLNLPFKNVTSDALADEEFVATLVKLYRDKKLLVKKEYPLLRKLFAERFDRLHGTTLRQAYGGDADAMHAWFEGHTDVREDFYIALDPAHDNLSAAAKIFNDLRKGFEGKLAPYAQLAIATSVVWDQANGGVYEYGHHCNRCKAVIPANLMAAMENFKYYVDAEATMEGRIRHVPWELLKHVVNHRTPESERQWSMQRVAGGRSMFGKCYSAVPYDHEMLRTHSQFAKLNGKEYTLPNILSFGGVCAMQADFASRVGKSIGVSSEYVTGEAAGGELHAWVMWVELKQATATGLQFTLESHGRYFGDKYYLGHLRDPQTGERITDRDMELRLQTVGLDTVAKRHSELIMQAYPQFRDKAELDKDAQLQFLIQVINYCPGCETAWRALAQFARESNGDKKYTKQMQAVLTRLFTTFARVPDFTWKVFGDLAAYYAEGKQREALYDRLIQLYEQAERPDLACEARLVWADMLAGQEKKLDAIQGLAASIKKFPGEGRYVPRLLDKLESLCDGVKGADQQLVTFYTQVLPLVPKTRGSEPSPFAMKMFRRAADTFTRLNQPELAQAASAELTKLQAASRGPI